MKNAVQEVMKLIPADVEGKVLLNAHVPSYLDKEITLYYYIGKQFILDYSRRNVLDIIMIICPLAIGLECVVDGLIGRLITHSYL